MTINQVPLQTIDNLLQAFPGKPYLIPRTGDRIVPIGIEVEVPWRAYFPDLWVEGFPDVGAETLARITAECTEREKILLPKLMKTVECGVKSGADKYWEFAFDPVLDVSILCNQVSILQYNDLIPKGHHSLHITFGGIRLTRSAHYIAMVLEAVACNQARVLQGFTKDGASTGWARKGYAGMFEKSGEYDLMHGYEVGTEIRLLYLPEGDIELFALLNVAQKLACLVYDEQQYGSTPRVLQYMINECGTILGEHGLPNTNWKKPHMNRDIWTKFAADLPSIQYEIAQRILPLLT